MWLALAIAVQLGNCYRAEIDLSPLVGASGKRTDAESGAGGPADDGSPGSGGNPNTGLGVDGGGGGLPGVEVGVTSGGDEQRGAEGGAAGGVAGETTDRGGAGGWIAINTGGACQDEPLSVEHSVCHVTGVKPGVKECAEADGSEYRWRGCYNGGCAVCTLHGELPGYPYYFDWHPCCSKNDTCSNHDPFVCNALCPAPTEHDKVAPCGKLDPNPG